MPLKSHATLDAAVEHDDERDHERALLLAENARLRQRVADLEGSAVSDPASVAASGSVSAALLAQLANDMLDSHDAEDLERWCNLFNQAVHERHREHAALVRRTDELQALLETAKAMLEQQDFKTVARHIFGTSCRLIGASAGYIALLSPDGTNNNVLFLESGGMTCEVDPALPMPVRGLRERAYATHQAVVDNDFMRSAWVEFLPTGHVSIKNVMFAPLNVEGLTIGVMGLANKPTDFTESDRTLAQAFADLAAVALRNSKNIEALKNSEGLLCEAERLARIGSWEWDLASQTLRWSDEVYRIFGREPRSFAPSVEAFLAMIHPDDREHFLKEREKMLAERQEACIDHRIVWPDGRVRHVQERTWLLLDKNGKVYRVTGTVQDIDERKLLEAEREKLQTDLFHSQKMEAVGTLAGGIAHDFNNILAGLMSGLSVFELQQGGDPKGRAELEEMKALVRRGADLTKQILGFARRGKYDVGPIDVAAVIEKTSAMFGRTRRDIVIRHELGAGLRPVLMDHTQLEQVLLNLFVNAGQAMPHGGRLTIRAENAERAEVRGVESEKAAFAFVRVVVTDTGLGIDKAIQTRIFEPFFTTKEPGQGSGLGLASVYGIIKNHGGRISVESEPGHGAAFTLMLPATDKPIPADQQTTAAPHQGQGTILLVDDEEYLLRNCGRLLRAMGYDVLTAADGAQAIEVVREHGARISLVILDLTMPVMGGAETFGVLREIAPTLKVLLASGFSEDGLARDLLARGCNGFIQKPFDFDTLSAKLNALL